MSSSTILLLITITLMYSTPLVFGGLGGVLCERSGVVNIGIEGMMTVGASVSVIVAHATGSPWIGFLAGGLAGGALAILHAVASITFRADQTISGIAMNLLGPGIALFLASLTFDGATNTPSVPKKLPKIATPIGDLDVTVFIALIGAFVLWFVLYKTKWGLRIRAVGEHPAAADTLGVNVSVIRYVCVIISGVLSGFGGASVTLAIISNFTPTAISGQGFIALAAVIFGKWTPHGVYGACLLFGFAQALAVQLGGENFFIPSQILSMLPYVLTLVVLVLFVGRSSAPKASGEPYVKGTR